MRFYRLGDVPAGLHYDEAFNGLDALALVDIPLTDWPIFFNDNYGREPLFIWLSGLAHALFGPSIWTARFISALSGVLLIPATAWLGWQIAPLLRVGNRQQFALWSAAAILALLWSQIFARFGIRATLFVLVETMLWAAVWRAWQRRPPAVGAWVIAGVLAGLSFYTYLPARLLPLVFLLLLVAAYLQDRTRLQRHLSGLLSCALATFLVALPLGIYFLQNPLAFSTRTGQATTGIEREDVIANLWGTLAMFMLSGDHDLVSNLPFRPVLDPILALPFLIGIGLALRRCWQSGRVFLLVGGGTMLLPTVLSDYAPNFIRAIGALPFIALLVAYGAEGFVSFIGLLSGLRVLRAAQSLVWTILAVSVALTNWTYFGVWQSSPAQFYGWAVGFNQLARHIDANEETRVYISPRDPAHPNPAAPPHPAANYLLPAEGVDPQYHDERSCVRVALAAPARYVSLTGGDRSQSLRIDSYYADVAPPSTIISDSAGRPWATEIKKARDTPVAFPMMRPYNVELADGIALSGYRLSAEELQADQSLNVRLFWRVHRTPTADYTLFLHLLHVKGDGSLEQLVGFDGPPGKGACPMTEWLPGEMVIHDVETVLPAVVPPGNLFLAIGFYMPSDMRRMPVALSADDHILIGPLSRSP